MSLVTVPQQVEVLQMLALYVGPRLVRMRKGEIHTLDLDTAKRYEKSGHLRLIGGASAPVETKPAPKVETKPALFDAAMPTDVPVSRNPVVNTPEVDQASGEVRGKPAADPVEDMTPDDLRSFVRRYKVPVDPKESPGKMRRAVRAYLDQHRTHAA